MWTIFLKVLVIFLMVAVGFVAAKAKVLPEEANPYMVSLMLDITCPCLIVASMTDIELTSKALSHTVQVMVGEGVFFGVLMGLSYLVVRELRYTPASDRGVLMVLICTVNSGFMGFPVTLSIFGKYYLFLMVMGNVLLNMYMFVLLPWQLHWGAENGSTALPTDSEGEGSSVLKNFLNPCNVAVVIGLVLLFGQIPLPGPLFETVDTIGQATIPISMIVVGMQLAGSRLSGILANYKLVICCLLNVLAVPALTFLCVNWLPLATEVKVILVFTACFPSAVAPVGIAGREGANARLMAEGVSLTTLLSMATLPLAAVFLMHFYGL